MKKRLLAIMLGLMMAFALAACGSSDSEESEQTEEVSEDSQAEDESTEMTIKEEYEKVEISEASEVDQMAEPQEGETIAIMEVEGYGNLCFKFFNSEAPLAVENFLTLAANGYYDGVTFHRVIDNFMIQGGDPTATGAGGESIWGQEFKNEYSDILLPLRGALCMANAGTDTNGSQFFVVQNKVASSDTYGDKQYSEEKVAMFDEYGGYPYLADDYTIFGQLYDGYDVLDKIAETETDSNDKPVEDVVISKITVKTAE